MKTVLLVLDRPHWAFDNIAKQLINHNNRNFHLKTYHLKGNFEEFSLASSHVDLVFFFHWSLAARISNPLISFSHPLPFRKKKIKFNYFELKQKNMIAGIHAHHDFDDKKTQPGLNISPPHNLINFLSQFKAVNAVSKRLVNIFCEAGLKNVCYTPNGVDVDFFKPLKPLNSNSSDKLRVGYIGTKKRDWKEGISEFVEPLGKQNFIKLNLAIPEDGNYVSPDKMPEFINNNDVFICTSSSEGFPLKVLEPSACGRPIISTKVGGAEELIIDSENGFLVERKLESFIERLSLLHKNRDFLIKLGARNREIIEKNWSWTVRSKAWLDYIERNLNQTPFFVQNLI